MNGGDQLARGAKSAQFPASDGKVSQDAWDACFADYEPNKEMKSEQRSGLAYLNATGKFDSENSHQ